MLFCFLLLLLFFFPPLPLLASSSVPSTSTKQQERDSNRGTRCQQNFAIFPPVKQLSQLPSMGKRNGLIPQMANSKPSEITPKGSKPIASNSDDPDEKSKGAVVQQKGRFKVTSENALPPLVLQKSHSMQVISQIPAGCLPSPSTEAISNNFGCSLHQHLLSILQTNVVQRDYILNLMRQVNTGDISVLANRMADGGCTPVSSNTAEKTMLELAHEREKELLQEITDLQWRLVCAQEEIQRLKTRKS